RRYGACVLPHRMVGREHCSDRLLRQVVVEVVDVAPPIPQPLRKFSAKPRSPPASEVFARQGAPSERCFLRLRPILSACGWIRQGEAKWHGTPKTRCT